MRSTGNFHPEWGYLAPSSNFIRTARTALIAVVVGSSSCPWLSARLANARSWRAHYREMTKSHRSELSPRGRRRRRRKPRSKISR
jgi:hypothetical protein